MLPGPTDPRWKALIEGTITHRFATVSASMMISRLIRTYRLFPTEETLRSAIDEAYHFFQKYESLTAQDLHVLFK